MGLDTLPDVWRAAPRRWGHQFHSLCSYMAMFPPTIPHVFINWFTKPGDVVYDPFSGRGTAPLEACLLGRRGLGSDANPLAGLLTGAKVAVPRRETILHRLRVLRRLQDTREEAVPKHIRMLFHPDTLAQLLWLREELQPHRPSDRFLLAVLSGILHRNADSTGRPMGLTVSMPNTFAMAPGYVSSYIEDHGLEAPKVDVLAMLEAKVRDIEPPPPSYMKGRAWLQDATRRVQWPRGIEKAKLIFTSPPYLEVMLYGKYNWIRLWLLKSEPKAVDARLFTSRSVKKYLEFMKRALSEAANVLRDDGYICLVIGDVRRKDKQINLASQVAAESVPGHLRVIGIIADELPVEHKVSRIWKHNKGRATKTDRIIILGGPDAPKPPKLKMTTWKRAV